MRKVLSFFVMLLVSIITTTSFAQDELTRVPVFTMGESGSQYYRIPAIVETENGTLVAIADQRGNALGDLPNIISIVAKTSTDKGATWNSMVTIAQGSATAGTTYGDAVAVYDEETGKIITVFVGNENYGTNCVGLWASNSTYPLRLYKSESSDNGASWTTPVDITESIYNAVYGSRTSWIGGFAGSGSAVQLKKGDKAGRLMFVVALRQNSTWGGNCSNYAVYSDDNGATWQVSTAACTSGDEAKVVELENGDLLMSIKNRKDDSSNGSGYRLMAKSTDQGATWTTAEVNNNLMDPACNGDVVSIEYDGQYYLLHSLPASTSTRENVTVYASLDGGETWPISRKIYDGYSAYSSLEVLNDGTIGILVEEGKWDGSLPGEDGFNIGYYNFTMDWLLATTNFDALEMVEKANELLSKGGVGYPNAIAKAKLRSAKELVEADASTENVATLTSAIQAFYTTDEIELPQVGKTYTFISKGVTADYYMYNGDGTLSLASYTEGMELPDAAKFTCEYDETAGKYMFKTFDGAYYMAYPTIGGKSWLDNESETGLESSASRVTQLDIQKISIDANVSATAEDLFGYVHLWGYRGYDNGEDVDMEGPVIVKTSAGAFDGAGGDFYIINANGEFTSAFEIKPVSSGTPIILDRSAWTATASSYEYDGEGSAGGWPEHTIDDDPATFWHTDYSVTPNPTVPHWLQYNMGSSYEITAFTYVSRTADGANITCNGNVKTYKFYVSDTEISSNIDATTKEPVGLTPAAEGEFTYDRVSTEHHVELAESVKGQYLYLLVTDSWNSNPTTKFGNCSEFYAYGISDGPAPTTYTVTVTASPAEGGTATVNNNTTAEVVEGANATFTATPATGYEFVNWTYTNGQVVTTDLSFREKITGSVEYIANFSKIVVETEYCTVTGNINQGRHLASFSISNGTETLDVQGTTSGGAVYINRSRTAILEVKQGGIVTFPAFGWQGEWMHAYAYIDYDNDKEFNTTANNDGTTGGEVVTYNCLNEKTINGDNASAQYANTRSYTNEYGTSKGLPAFKLPDLIEPGDYRMRIAAAWNTLSPCGYSDIKPHGGILLDMTIRVLEPDTYFVKVSSSNEELGTAYIGEEGTTDARVANDGEQTLELTAVVIDPAYEFANWTLDGEVVSTEAVYTTTAITENRNYVANFQVKTIAPRTVKVSSNNKQKGYAVFVSPIPEGTATDVTTSEWVTVRAITQTPDDFFVNWTINGEVVGTESEYIYKGEEAATVQANFISKYVLNYSIIGNGTVTLSTEAGGVISGERVEEGVAVRFIATPAQGVSELTSINQNGAEILAATQREEFSDEFIMSGTTEMVFTFEEMNLSLTYNYSGSGYIEVWSDDSQEGEQYANGSYIPLNGDLYIFAFAQDGYELESLIINGESSYEYEGETITYVDEVAEYGTAYYTVSGDVTIEAVFTGSDLVGIADADAEAVQVYATDGVIYINGYEGEVKVVNISGQVVNEFVANGNAEVSIAQGIYFVVSGDQVTKVVVK
ncbi:MAG: exo-alpha-sialidase [Bacteroidaceae bacterium]|nr:exo-alpha-sialidase [Bacteroidaceae bacterium]